MAITRKTSHWPAETYTDFNQILADMYIQSNPDRMFQPVLRDRKYIMKTDPLTGETRAEPVTKLVVHEFRIGDVEDPDIYAGQELYNWQHSPQGQWVLEHALHPPVWHRSIDAYTMGYRICITAEFSGADATWLSLSDQIPGV